MQDSQQLDDIDQCHLKQQEICTKKKQMEKIIDEILKKVDSKSLNSINCMHLIEQLNLLQPILENVDASLKDVQQEKFIKFYKIFQKVFKQFEETTQSTNKLVEETFKNGMNLPKEKVQQITDRILAMKNELMNLQKGVFSSSKKYLVWVDPTLKSGENQIYMEEFQKICNGVVKVYGFEKYDEFRQFIEKKKDQMIYVIMSGKAAGSYPGDGDNLNWIKQFIKQQNGYQVIYGVYIFTSYVGYPYFEPLKKTEKGLILDVFQNPKEIFDSVFNIIFPKNSVRVIRQEQVGQFLTHKKEEFLKFGVTDYSKYNLNDLHPDKPFKIDENYLPGSVALSKYNGKNLLDRLNLAKKMITEFQLGVPEDQIDPLYIYTNLKDCFKGDNSAVAKNILILYTRGSPYYRFVNSVLSVMNEELMIVLWDLILSLRVALSIYDDSNYSSIKNTKFGGTEVNLFRGAAIPEELFTSTYKENKLICMCGFTSFTTIETVAQGFCYFGEGLRIVFKFPYSCGTEQYNNRPKYLDKISSCPGEQEYLISCAMVFKVKSIVKQKNSDFIYVELMM